MFFEQVGVFLHRISRACGEIGRRARLRIWYREMCRFESYQAHSSKTATSFSKEVAVFCWPSLHGRTHPSKDEKRIRNRIHISRIVEKKPPDFENSFTFPQKTSAPELTPSNLKNHAKAFLKISVRFYAHSEAQEYPKEAVFEREKGISLQKTAVSSVFFAYQASFSKEKPHNKVRDIFHKFRPFSVTL